ncbi:hypothetical protein FACS1894216_04910 [Synergistales bacterium]|nr:hypothetical protein FACS1894216_04910 [Synergistales bacterium]
MTYHNIACAAPVNGTDAAKVAEIVKSIEDNGWQGMPILVCDDILVTGCHRQAALGEIARKCDEGEYDDDMEEKMVNLLNDRGIAANVRDLMDDYYNETGECFTEFDHLALCFEGTWVEDYKDELREW